MWKKVEAILDGALERPPADREAYVRVMSGGDELVIREALGILSALEESEDSFLDRPAMAVLRGDSDAAETTDLTGQKLSQYTIRQRIGEGGMAVVYRAWDPEHEREVALKVLPSWAARSTEFQRRFEVEARAASSLDHPNICGIYELAQHDGRAFIVMEYVDGISLHRVLERSVLPTEAVVDLSVQICDGLGAAHKHHIVHRDIKPSNIIVRADGRVKILDFGLAKILNEETMTRTGARMGSERYMSPEQIRGDRVDPRTDMWSFGVVLYELLTGRHPFEGEPAAAFLHRILTASPVPPSKVRPTADPRFDDLVSRLLAKRPDKRPRHTDEVKERLQRIVAPRVSEEAERRAGPRIRSLRGLWGGRGNKPDSRKG
jgi:serine/threonine protein kinase